MTLRPYWQFYKDCFPFILAFGLICAVLFGWILGIVLFCTLGALIGFQAFKIFKADQFYFYYNLGITKKQLFKKVAIINLVIAIPMSIFFLLISFLFGNLTLI